MAETKKTSTSLMCQYIITVSDDEDLHLSRFPLLNSKCGCLWTIGPRWPFFGKHVALR